MRRYSQCTYPELLYEVNNVFQKKRQLTKRTPQGDSTTEPKRIPKEPEIVAQRDDCAQKVQSESLIGSKLQSKIKSRSSEDLLHGTTSTESQIYNNVDVQALGYVKSSKLDVNQNMEQVAEELKKCEQTSRNTEKLPMRNKIILSPKMAEELLVLLDAMSLRLIQCETKEFRQLNSMLAGAQEQINDTRKILEDLPQHMEWDDIVEYVIEVGSLVEEIFSTLESLTCKLIECHTKELCKTMVDLQQNLKVMFGNLPPPKKHERKISTQEGSFGLELTTVAICFMLCCFVIYLLAHPVISEVVAEFYSNATTFY